MQEPDIMDAATLAALDRLAQRWKHDVELKEQLGELTPFKLRQANDQKAKEDYAHDMISIVRAGRSAGRFSEEMHAYYANFYLRGIVHEGRIAGGHYDAALALLAAPLEEMRRRQQLSAGEAWLQGQGPPEYETLNDEYERRLDAFVPALFREFGEWELADLLESNPERFEALERAGFKAVHQKSSPAENLALLIERYKREGELAGKAGAYYAACAMLGAAIEATLLALCYQHPGEAEAARRRLRREFRPASDPERWSLLDLVVIAVVAGWIPDLRTGSLELTTGEWVRRIDQLRQFRNLLHPGKHLATRPGVQLGREEYDDARAIFEVVDYQLRRLKAKA